MPDAITPYPTACPPIAQPITTPTCSSTTSLRFNGAEKTNVEEYCVSEGWIRVSVSKAKDRFSNPLTIKLNGTVEPYFREEWRVSATPPRCGSPDPQPPPWRRNT